MSLRSRVALALLAVAGVLCLCWYLARTPTTSSLASVSESQAAADSSASTQLLAPGTASSERAEAVTSTAATEESATPGSADKPIVPLRHLSGTLKYFDPYGAHRPVLHGAFRLTSYEEEAPHTVPVEQGSWALDVAAANFDVEDFVAEGSPCVLHTLMGGMFKFPPDGTLALLVRRNSGCRLVVVDARSGRELHDVEVVRDGGRFRGGKMSPDGSAAEVRIAEHASSPIELTLEDDRDNYFVRSPGFAWRVTQVFRNACGDHVVALRPGGDLSVRLGGSGAPEGAELRVRLVRDDQDPYASQYVDHMRALGPLVREFDFTSIEAGSYEVSVEVGTNAWKSARIAAQNCVVSVGKRTRVELALSSVEPAVLVRAGGTIRADGWPFMSELTLYARQAPRVGGRYEYTLPLSVPPGVSDVNVRAWNFDAIEPGTYSGFIKGASWYFDFTIDPVHRDDYVIVVPPAAHARVRVIDAERGGPAAVEQVLWLGYTEEWRPGGQFNQTRFEAGDATWHFDAPAGSVILWVNDDDFEFRNVPVQLSAGNNELELRIAQACGITLTFMCGGVPIARDLSWEIQLAKLDGSIAGYANPLDGEETELILKAPAPGKYRISAQGLDGYRFASTLDVTVPARGFARVVVVLERVR